MHQRRPETFALCMVTMPSERAWQENGSLILRRIVLTRDTSHSGRPSGFDEDRLNTLIHNDPCQCTRELANVNYDHSTILQHLHSMSKIKKLDVRVLHALSQNHKNQQVVICASLLAHHQLAREQH